MKSYKKNPAQLRCISVAEEILAKKEHRPG